MSARVYLSTLVTVVLVLALPVSGTAREDRPSADSAARINVQPKQHHRYKLIDLGTFGGPLSYFNPGSGNVLAQFARVLNKHGVVAGLANTSLPDPFLAFCFDLDGDCLITHAFEAPDGGGLIDLGALPDGPSSAATSISDNGLIAGVSQNGELDPLLPGVPELRAVLWQKGQIVDLGTLPEGGYESYAAAVNNSGQAVGAAINTVPDPNSMSLPIPANSLPVFWLFPGFPYETRAFLWEQGKGMQDLGTLAGGTDALATLINEAGQVVGHSYNSAARSPLCFYALSTGSFIWERGKGMQDLGSFGGTCTLAEDLNDRGQVVGASNLPGDQAGRAFLWDHGSMHELGGSLGGDFTGAFAVNEAGNAVGFATLSAGPNAPSHAVLWNQVGQLTDLGPLGTEWCSYANSINDRRQIVGPYGLCSGAGPGSVFLWEDGTLFDLNALALIPTDSTLRLLEAETINNRGEIAGRGVDADGNDRAFLLIPCDDDHQGVEGCDYGLVDSAQAAPRPAAGFRGSASAKTFLNKPGTRRFGIRRP